MSKDSMTDRVEAALARKGELSEGDAIDAMILMDFAEQYDTAKVLMKDKESNATDQQHYRKVWLSVAQQIRKIADRLKLSVIKPKEVKDFFKKKSA